MKRAWLAFGRPPTRKPASDRTSSTSRLSGYPTMYSSKHWRRCATGRSIRPWRRAGADQYVRPSTSVRSSSAPTSSIPRRASPTVRLAHQREVLHAGRPVASEVPSRQLGKRGVSAKRQCRPDAFVDERVGLLLAVQPAAADQQLELGVHEHVGEVRAIGGDAVAVEQRSDLRARHSAAAGEGLGQQRIGPHERACVQAEPPVHRVVPFADARSRKLDQPADVVGGDEVPRVAQDVRAQDLAGRESVVDRVLGQRAATLAERPSRNRVLLRLHRAEVPHDGGRAAGQRAYEALVEQSLPRELESSAHHHRLPIGCALCRAAHVRSCPCTG